MLSHISLQLNFICTQTVLHGTIFGYTVGKGCIYPLCTQQSQWEYRAGYIGYVNSICCSECYHNVPNGEAQITTKMAPPMSPFCSSQNQGAHIRKLFLLFPISHQCGPNGSIWNAPGGSRSPCNRVGSWLGTSQMSREIPPKRGHRSHSKCLLWVPIAMCSGGSIAEYILNVPHRAFTMCTPSAAEWHFKWILNEPGG